MLKTKKDDEKQIIEIEGIKYSYAIFKWLGYGLKLNQPFIITERKDGVITVAPIKVDKYPAADDRRER